MIESNRKVSHFFVRLFLLAALCCFAGIGLSSCGSSGTVYKASEAKWQGDSIYFQLARIDNGTPAEGLDADIYCRNCNLITTGWEVTLNPRGEAVIYIPESRELLSTWVKVLASGIDTTLVLKQESPTNAQSKYHLSTPLVGRVIATQAAMLYNNAELDSVIDHIDAGDELNIFRQDTYVYEVHHPRYNHPLYLLRSNAVRMF